MMVTVLIVSTKLLLGHIVSVMFSCKGQCQCLFIPACAVTGGKGMYVLWFHGAWTMTLVQLDPSAPVSHTWGPLAIFNNGGSHALASGQFYLI